DVVLPPPTPHDGTGCQAVRVALRQYRVHRHRNRQPHPYPPRATPISVWSEHMLRRPLPPTRVIRILPRDLDRQPLSPHQGIRQGGETGDNRPESPVTDVVRHRVHPPSADPSPTVPPRRGRGDQGLRQ